MAVAAGDPGVAWIHEPNKKTVVTVVDPLHENRSVAVETQGVKSEIITKIVGGMPHITIKISGGGNITEEDDRISQGIDKVKKQVENLLDRQIAADIKVSLKKIQREYNSDVVGLAAFIHVQHNREWKSGLKEKWKTIFPQVPIKVRVEYSYSC